MKTMQWLSQKGSEIKLVASCEMKMQIKTVDLDGDVRVVGKQINTNANLKVLIDGKKLDSCWDINFWDIIDVSNTPYKRIHGINGMMMTAERAAEVEQFLQSVIEEGKNEEVRDFEAEEKRKEQQTKINEANEIMRKAEKSSKNADGSLMTNEQARVWRRNYNNTYNEGEDGYIPEIITQKEYDWAKSILNK